MHALVPVRREYVSSEDFELFFNDRKTAAKAFACFDVDGDNHVTRREVGCIAAHYGMLMTWYVFGAKEWQRPLPALTWTATATSRGVRWVALQHTNSVIILS